MQANFRFTPQDFMAEITPNAPDGGLPPRPSEAAKVQPKKETVRINLPPKPTASPTVKLPMLPAGAPPPSAATAAPMAPRVGAPPPPPPNIGVPKPPAPPASGTAGTRVATPPTGQKPAIAAPAAAPVAVRKPVAAATSVSGLDKGLAFAAMVVSLVALGSVIYLGWFLTNQPAS